MNSFFKLLFLTALMSGASFSAQAQACGYSTVTIYLQDAGGRAIENAVFVFVEAANGSDAHYRQITKTYWDAKRKAYISTHGLCGEHNDAVVRISSEGFEAVERKLDLPFGRQGFILKLKRDGTNEEVSLEKLSCEKRGECASYAEMDRSQN